MKTQKYLLVLVGAASISSAAYSTDLDQIKNEAVKKAEQVADFANVLADKKFEEVTTYLAKNNGYLFTPAALEVIVNALEQAQSFVHSKLAMIPMKDIEGLPVSSEVVAGLKAAIEFSGKSVDLQPMVTYLSQIKLSPENFTKFVELLEAKSSKLDLSKVKAAVSAMEANKGSFEAAVKVLRDAKADKVPGKIAVAVEKWWNNKDNPAVWDEMQLAVLADVALYAGKLQNYSGEFAKVLETFAQFAVSIADLAKQVVSVYGPVLADAVPAQEKAQINKAVMFVKDRFGDVKEKVSPVINKVKNAVSSLR